MLGKIFVFSFLFLSLNLFAAEETLEVMVKKMPQTEVTEEILTKLFTINGQRQAITKDLLDKKLDSEKFWDKMEEKKLSDDQETEFFNTYFTSINLVEAAVKPEESFLRASFKYDLNQEKIASLYSEILSNLPDVSIKTFYIIPDIRISQEMTWTDVGVVKKENFVGVIVDSWKKWAETQFKSYPNVVILEKDITPIPANLNPESVTLKWSSLLKKGEVYQDRKSARFELTSQYVLVSTKNNQPIAGFDFPTQKKEVGIANSKDLSSNLASLTYNLLNSQTAKINSALEMNRAASTLTIVEIKVVGKHGLSDITQVNSFLNERFKNIALTSELKRYSGESSTISIKSTASAAALYEILAKDGGKYPINEQKILLFSPADKTFAFIAKEANN